MYVIKNLLNKFLSKEVHHKTLTSDWYGVDSKINFERNINTKYKELKHYTTNPIGYKWNKDKFRSDFEFIPNKDLKVDIYLGCSHTMGTGHFWENTWPYLTSQSTGNKIVNLGVGGKDIELSFINLTKYINYFNTQNIFHYQPIYARYCFPSNDKIVSILAQNVNLNNGEEDYVPWRKNYIKEELLNDDYIVYNHYKYTMSIEGLSKNYNIPYYHLNELPKITPTEGTLHARDLVHYNTTQQKAIADKFIRQLKVYENGYNEFIENNNNGNQILL